MFRIGTFIFYFLLFISTEICGQYSNCNFLCNTDFETDLLVQSGQFGFFDQDRVSCWNTTATDRMIEIWGSGFGGVPAYSGNQFAELNANMVSTLFQNFTAAHGGIVEISFAHRGRAGVDKLSVEIGPSGGPYENLGTFSADKTSWVFNKIKYTFPDTGRIDFTIRFNSVSAAGGPTVGNFLDAIDIKLTPPEADFVITKPSCPDKSDGVISIRPLKGSMPFTYFWYPPLNSNDSILLNLSAGRYQLEVKDFYGCKINYDLLLDAANQKDTTQIFDSACHNYTWATNGKTYTSSGIYTTTLQNRGGCDSIINLQLTIQKSDSSLISISNCNSYTWPLTGQSYFQSGVYQDTFTNIYGCDSIVYLDLQILTSHAFTDSVKICNSYTWPVNGKLYKQSGTYADTLTNLYGCDSIVYLALEIFSPQKHADSVRSCGSYTWPVNGRSYTQNGLYSDTLSNVYGCDSILNLILEISPSQSFTDHIRRCDSYTWPVNGKTYVQNGLYSDTLSNIYRCDSILNLVLEIVHTQNFTNSVKTCNSFLWPVNGKQYMQSGNYSDTLSTIYGCDSILNLNLEILPLQILTDSVQICDSFTWPANGQSYTQSGYYEANFQNSLGCDSIMNLQLTILKSTFSEKSISACDHFLLESNGENYTQSGTYQNTATNSLRCDSTFTLHLQIYPSYLKTDTVRQCKEYTWPTSGKTYKQSGNYRLDLQSNYGCDSVQLLNLRIDTDYIIYDTVSTFEQYIWPVNKEFYKESGVYETLFSSKESCDSLRVLVLEIKHSGTIYIPNVFSPNGDGINDKFTIYSSPEIAIIDRLLVYDRWGELLFEQNHFPPNDFHYGWNGSFRTQNLNPSVFVYTVEWIDLKGEKHIERGDVTLIK